MQLLQMASGTTRCLRASSRGGVLPAQFRTVRTPQKAHRQGVWEAEVPRNRNSYASKPLECRLQVPPARCFDGFVGVYAGSPIRPPWYKGQPVSGSFHRWLTVYHFNIERFSLVINMDFSRRPTFCHQRTLLVLLVKPHTPFTWRANLTMVRLWSGCRPARPMRWWRRALARP